MTHFHCPFAQCILFWLEHAHFVVDHWPKFVFHFNERYLPAHVIVVCVVHISIEIIINIQLIFVFSNCPIHPLVYIK